MEKPVIEPNAVAFDCKLLLETTVTPVSAFTAAAELSRCATWDLCSEPLLVTRVDLTAAEGVSVTGGEYGIGIDNVRLANNGAGELADFIGR